jgi:hypothetical protein
MSQNGFLLIIPFLGRSGVTDPYRNHIENSISGIHCCCLKFNMFVEFHILKNACYRLFKSCLIYSEALIIAVLHKILKNSKNN